jgi:hypothetical protein
MADFVFNRAKGRGTQWTEEIRGSVAPYANSAIVISLWRRGSGTDAALKDYDDVAALEGDAQAAELASGVNANYARKTLIDTTPTIQTRRGQRSARVVQRSPTTSTPSTTTRRRVRTLRSSRGRSTPLPLRRMVLTLLPSFRQTGSSARHRNDRSERQPQ